MRETLSAMMANVSDHVGKARIIANNTVRYQRADGSIVFRLHHTDIVARHPDGTFTLSTGGWKTVTTKARLNEYGPCAVRSDRGVWFVGNVPFYDGMRIGADGKPVTNGVNPQTALKDAKALKAKIAKFVKLVDTCPKLPTPNGSDCWLCMIHSEPSRDNGRQLEFNTVPNQSGPTNNTEHLMSHIEEGYLHGTLLVNAMRWAGSSDRGIQICYGSNLRDNFKRALRRYLNRKLGLAS